MGKEGGGGGGGGRGQIYILCIFYKDLVIQDIFSSVKAHSTSIQFFNYCSHC